MKLMRVLQANKKCIAIWLAVITAIIVAGAVFVALVTSGVIKLNCKKVYGDGIGDGQLSSHTMDEDYDILGVHCDNGEDAQFISNFAIVFAPALATSVVLVIKAHNIGVTKYVRRVVGLALIYIAALCVLVYLVFLISGIGNATYIFGSPAITAIASATVGIVSVISAIISFRTMKRHT